MGEEIHMSLESEKEKKGLVTGIISIALEIYIYL